MNYKSKYIKYKYKYLELKNQIGAGGEPKCTYNNIIDLDCLVSDEFLLNNRVSKNTIDYLRNELQHKYEIFYNLLNYPELEYEELTNTDLLEEIIIPIIREDNNIKILDITKKNLGKVNYEKMAIKLANNDLENYIKLKKEYDEIPEIKKNGEYYEIKELNNKIEEAYVYLYNNIIKKLKESKIDISLYQEFIKEVDENKIKPFNEYKKIFGNIKTPYYDECKLVIDIFQDKKLWKNILEEDRKLYNEIISEWNKYMNLISEIIEIKDKYADIINDKTDKYNKINNHKLNKNSSLEDLIKYDEKLKLTTDQQENAKLLLENKKKDIIEKIKNNFDINSNINCQIVRVSLKWFDNSNDNIKLDGIGHANAILIVKYKNSNGDAYLCIRIEPHRHSNIYCRNSIRKAIRDIFTQLPNSTYLDYVIDTRVGLQADENNVIEKNDLSDYKDLPKNIQKLSPLQGNTGFCTAWTMYTMIILILNRDKPLDKIGKYLATFNIKLDEKNIISTSNILDELKGCYPDTKQIEKTNNSCKDKEEILDKFKKYIDYKKEDKYISYTIPKESNLLNKNPKYILTKHIKLYRTIMVIFYYITKKFGITDIYQSEQITRDKTNIDKTFEEIEKNIGKHDFFKEVLESMNKKQISDIKDDISSKDKHYCDDNIFEHKDFCQLNSKEKEIPNKYKDRCKSETGKYKLIGLQENEENKQLEHTQVKQNISDILKYIK
jgi:RNase P protein component